MNNLFLSLFVAVLFSATLCTGLETKNEAKISAERGFCERWCDFLNRSPEFPLWKPDWDDESLKEQFRRLYEERWAVYFLNPEECHIKGAVGRYKEAFQTPEQWKTWGSRYPYPGAFCFNLAIPSYNASLIVLHGKYFIALEAPTQENMPAFCNLLSQYQVTDLVRLTPAKVGTTENSFPYWEGHLNVARVTGTTTIEIDGREMRYLATDCWEDHHGLEPDRLIAIVKALMASETDEQMIAVHCREGVGRTGTLLAAYTIIRDIDEQIAHGVDPREVQVSIDKIFWELSLQRPFTITHFSQYRSLYQLMGAYLESLETKASGLKGV